MGTTRTPYRRPFFYPVAIICTLLFIAGNATAQFYYLRTQDLRLIYYDKEDSYILPHLSRCFENSMKFHRNLFHYTPSEEVMVFLQDFDDFGYGGTTSNPYNFMVLGLEPYEYVYETSPTNERFNWVMNHELAHVVASDKAAGIDRFFRSLFRGKIVPTAESPESIFYAFLTNPRTYSPRWYHEGFAVFLETWMAGGIGRVLGGYDEMVFRTMVRDSSRFYDVIGLESEGTTIDFQIGANAYLYGTRFVTHLVDHYGPDKLIQWYDRTDDSHRFFASQFENVYGVSLDDEWSHWIEWEHEWQRENLDSLRQYPITPYRILSDRTLGSVSRPFYDRARNKLYAAINYPGQLAQIAGIDLRTGQLDHICDVPTPALYYVCSLAYDPSGDKLFYTTNNTRDWRDLNAVDIKSGNSGRLVRGLRAGDLAFDPANKTIWGIQHNGGISRLVRVAPPYDGYTEMWKLDYGKDLFDLDISPDGSTLTASMIQISGRQFLIKMDIAKLTAGDHSYEVLYEFENNSPMNFVFSPDGRYLFGTTYYTGVSNVVRFDLQEKKMEWITNCETGMFRPTPVSPDSLIAFRYAGKGFIPVMIPNKVTNDVSAVRYLGQRIVDKYPVVKSWTIPSPLTVNIDSLTTSSGEYSALSNLRLANTYPVVEGYKEVPAFGVRLNFLDPLLSNDLNLIATYTPNQSIPENERFHAKLNYAIPYWEFTGTYNGTDFYDLFGPTKTSRKGYSLKARYKDFLLYDKPKTLEYSLGLAGYADLERLPEAQNVSTSFDKFLSTDGALDYKNTRRSLGAVESEAGTRWRFGVLDNYVNGHHFPRLSSALDYGFLLPLDHSSIWLRTAAGYSFGDRAEPFANFYFGGFGNNWVDYQDAKRYRDPSSFPGVELNEIGGTNFAKALFEWTLPPIRFRRLGILNLYCNWWHVSLFSSAVATNVDDASLVRTVFDAGSQIDCRLVIFSRLESTLSFGYAFAFEKEERAVREFMVSLKIL